ncbi:arsenate reductase [Paenibacillus cellulosilyticus]|uniref:Arsenate reductase n=1 Tax=Paenibacillus cellulosilyticus TaxID=375489 RepID=A0A2V2Z1H0_9BACL|nr:arsenate reductase family protein [Paenibacillus cellulosilyticus]PWW07401.1 arsenate reductase [Paenibacillus cellulosilyticus]QKS44433.1 arsenate reductase family protein [Paenibacillus cellulosilyticus]
MSTRGKLKIYMYAKCGTCRSAIKSLQAKGWELDQHDLFEQAPDIEELRTVIERSGLELKKFFNTSGEVYKELGLKDKLPTMSAEEQLKLLASNGRLVKRPIVTDGKRVTVGFKEETYEQEWGA